MSIDDTGNAALVAGAYRRCWFKSPGRYNRWIEESLTWRERALYVAINTTERVYATGFDGLLADGRFTLAKSADPLEQVGVPEQAAVLRQLEQDPHGGALPANANRAARRPKPSGRN